MSIAATYRQFDKSGRSVRQTGGRRLHKYLLRGFPGLFTVISEHICFLLLVFFSVFTLFSCRFRAVD